VPEYYRVIVEKLHWAKARKRRDSLTRGGGGYGTEDGGKLNPLHTRVREGNVIEYVRKGEVVVPKGSRGFVEKLRARGRVRRRKGRSTAIDLGNVSHLSKRAVGEINRGSLRGHLWPKMVSSTLMPKESTPKAADGGCPVYGVAQRAYAGGGRDRLLATRWRVGPS